MAAAVRCAVRGRRIPGFTLAVMPAAVRRTVPGFRIFGFTLTVMFAAIRCVFRGRLFCSFLLTARIAVIAAVFAFGALSTACGKEKYDTKNQTEILNQSNVLLTAK